MSEIRANTISDAAGTGPVTLTGQFAAKAWVNFNGTGTVAIRESGNVTSITDNGTGDYTVNFTTALTDANYAATYGIDIPSTEGIRVMASAGSAIDSKTTSSFRFGTRATNANLADALHIFLSFFR